MLFLASLKTILKFLQKNKCTNLEKKVILLNRRQWRNGLFPQLKISTWKSLNFLSLWLISMALVLSELQLLLTLLWRDLITVKSLKIQQLLTLDKPIKKSGL